MGRKPHKMLGIVSGIALITVANLHGWSMLYAMCGAYFGGNAPDDLEISSAVKTQSGWHRKSVIPHRTVTHWVLPWLFSLGVVAFCITTGDALLHSPFFLLFAGYVFGGVSHLIADVFNPTGVPMWLPRRKSRVSLSLWRSGCTGEFVFASLLLIGSVSLFYLFRVYKLTH